MESPEVIYCVSHTQFSIARHYGGCKINGCYYIYDPNSDTLTRKDVFVTKQKASKEKARCDKLLRSQSKSQERGLFDDR